jgi:hypothetical protein
MKRLVVRYKIKPEQVEENARLIENVFAELRTKAPDDVRYVTLKLSDGTFVHFATVDNDTGGNPITELDAFKAFSKTIAERCVDLPQSAAATVVGNYRMINE